MTTTIKDLKMQLNDEIESVSKVDVTDNNELLEAYKKGYKEGWIGAMRYILNSIVD